MNHNNKNSRGFRVNRKSKGFRLNRKFKGFRKNNLKFKQNVLVKNIDLISTQLRALNSMLEKRQDQLKKIAYPQISKPIQRVEPKQQNDFNNNIFNSSYSSCSSSPILFTNPQFVQQNLVIDKLNNSPIIKHGLCYMLLVPLHRKSG